MARFAVLLIALLTISQPTLSAPIDAIQRADYPAAIAIHPGDWALWDRWIAASLAAHQSEQAIALIRRAAALTGWTAVRRHQLADVLTVTDPGQAVIYERALLDGTLQDIPLLNAILATDLATHNWSDAQTTLNALIELAPMNGEAWYARAIFSAAADPTTALADLQRAATDPTVKARAKADSNVLSAHVSDPPVTRLITLGLQLTVDSQWALAEYVLDQAAVLDSANTGTQASAQALAFIGVAQDEQGRDGWPSIQEALVRAVNDPMVNYAAGLHWRIMGDYDAALAALSHAEARDPLNPALAAEIGTIYRLRDRPVDADTWFTLAIHLAPNDVNFWQILTQFYADNQYELGGNGMVMLQQAVHNFPKDTEIRTSLGEALLAIGQFSTARAELENAVKLDATNPRANYYLAVALEQQGDLSIARATYAYVYHTAPSGDLKDSAGRALQRLGDGS